MKILSLIISFLLIMGCNQTKSKNAILQNEKARISTEKAPALQNDTLFDFEKDVVGHLPKGWSQYFTGRAEITDWKIIDDHGNHVLAQLSQESPNYHFNEIVFDGFKARNVILKVRMKGVKGSMDQGGGFVWRFIDADNHYIVRANPLEDNVVLYKMENGKRKDLPLVGKGKTYGVDVEPLGEGWNDLKVTVVDSLFTVYLNNKEIFRVVDTTFIKSGKVGLWTKADAVTYFDRFEVINIP